MLMLLTPFVWVVDVSSCGGNGPVQTELTGLALLGKFDLEWTSLVLLSMAFTVLTPFMALKVTRAAWESCVHVLGLVATGFFVWLGHMTMFFTLFTDRSPYGVGVLVLALLLALLIDAGARGSSSACSSGAELPSGLLEQIFEVLLLRFTGAQLISDALTLELDRAVTPQVSGLGRFVLRNGRQWADAFDATVFAVAGRHVATLLRSSPRR
ncbi:MAG: hypothetical protein DI536_32495 [Archangium gephyra]|uniref:Uncharacterized protein n=1 Tax=Archangium gephyra TaxID=48 RepID=A0A2W5SR41_9BACT|nr:MAG: hypothetical protein DI536_32495 [Archangium gephyra]